MRAFLDTAIRPLCFGLTLLIGLGPALAQTTPNPATEEQTLAYAASQAQQNVCPWLFAHPATSAVEMNATLPNVRETEIIPYAGDDSFALAVRHAFPLSRVSSADFDVDNDGKNDTVFLIGYLQRRPGAAETNQVVEMKATLGLPTPPGGSDALLKQLLPPPGVVAAGVADVVPLNALSGKAPQIYYFDRWKLKTYRSDQPGMSSLQSSPGISNIRLLTIDGLNLLWVITGQADTQYLFSYTTEDSGTTSFSHRLVMLCQSS